MTDNLPINGGVRSMPMPIKGKSSYVIDATDSTNSKNIAIFGILGFILIGFALMELRAYSSDSLLLMKAQIVYVKERLSPPAKTQEEVVRSFLHKIYALLIYLKKKGLAHISTFTANTLKDHQSKVTPSECIVTESGRDLSQITARGQKESEFEEFYESYSELEKKHGEEAAQKLSADLLKNEPTIIRATQSYIDEDLVRGPITFWKTMKHLHFYCSIFAKPEFYNPRSLKLLIGGSAVLGELFVTGYFFYGFGRISTSEAIWEEIQQVAKFGVISALLISIWKVMISLFMVRKYMTDVTDQKELEVCETKHKKCRKAGVIIAILAIIGCVAGTVMLALVLDSGAAKVWMEAFIGAIVCDVLLFQMLKIAAMIGLGAWLDKMAQEKAKLLESKAFISLTNFVISYS